jgi:hypothetical protein
MSEYWLKMIGTAEMPCPDPYVLKFAAYTKKPRRVRPGDGLILYAVGGFKTIFAVATVKSPVKPSCAEWWPDPDLIKRFPFCVELQYEVNMKPSAGVDIGDANLDDHLPAIQFGHTHLSLSEEEFAYAAAKLREKATKLLLLAR